MTQGLEIGQVALKYGANDLGSIMIEENVVSEAGTTFRMDAADMRRLIKGVGLEARHQLAEVTSNLAAKVAESACSYYSS